MPPSVPRKRLRGDADDESPAHAPPRKRERATTSRTTPKSARKAVRGKTSLFDAVDGVESPRRTVEENKRFLEAQEDEDEGGDEQSGEDDDDDDDDFEDVPGVASVSNHGGRLKQKHTKSKIADGEDGDTDEDEMDWEDAIPSASHQRKSNHEGSGDGDTPINDISIALPTSGVAIPSTNLSFTDARGVVGKKGPSKIERQIRLNTHCMHVQFLMVHNSMRNGWLQDKECQDILAGQLGPTLKAEVKRWKRAIGMRNSDGDTDKSSSKTGDKSKASTGKGKGKAKDKSGPDARDRIRDWGAGAERLEEGTVDLSHGDPTIRLLKFLAAYWRKRFRITAPSLQKRGYLAPAELEADIKAWLKDSDDAEQFGERIRSKDALREAARTCEGSRDVGAQLFTALLRSVGLEARMVVSLQPVGFGFSKVEEGTPRKKKEQPMVESAIDATQKDEEGGLTKAVNKPKVRTLIQSRKADTVPTRRSTRSSNKTDAISLETSSDDGLSEAPTDVSTNSSIVNATPSKLPIVPVKPQPAPPFPTYWTEVFSPITKAFIPVISLPTPLIANSPDLVASFTPSGKAAEKSKQVLAYIVAFSADGTAKDVTVRYLKKKQWPGKTRGVRVAKERLPIYNKHGKVRKWIEHDWFGEVMAGYTKDPRVRTEAEEMEDEVQLVPVDPPKKDIDVEGGNGKIGGKSESLQAYKNSAEYVLERHLRREEAILPDSEPVRQFTSGKGDKATTEPVYRRADVVACKTVESWHKEGRAVKHGEQPLKLVPIRAVTLIRKREIEDTQRETGEKPMQGLYSKGQTDWIIPEPIGADRRIPKNAFGNIDVYVPTMVPAGAVHVPLKGVAKLCKRLGIDFAEACTGFEFGKQRAVPVLTGVVVAEENEEVVRDAWGAEQQRVKEKEAKKREEAALVMWKKFMQGLKIMERMQGEYGMGEKKEDESNPWVNKKVKVKNERRVEEPEGPHKLVEDERDQEMVGYDHDAETGGGFFPEGFQVEEVKPKRLKTIKADDEHDFGGGFVVDSDHETNMELGKRDSASTGRASPTPMSLQTAHSGKPTEQKKSTGSDGAMDESDEDASIPEPGNRLQGSLSVNRRLKSSVIQTLNNRTAIHTLSEDEDTSDLSNLSDSGSDSSIDSESSNGMVSSPEKRNELSTASLITQAPPKNKSQSMKPRSTRFSARKSSPVRAKAGTRAMPKRKSTIGVRSQYFEIDTDEEE